MQSLYRSKNQIDLQSSKESLSKNLNEQESLNMWLIGFSSALARFSFDVAYFSKNIDKRS